MKKLLLMVSVVLFVASVALADVTISNTKPVNAKWQFVTITLTVDGDSCRYTVATPVLSGAELQTYCNGREARYSVDILNDMYPGARYRDSAGDTDLEKFTQWIADGHTNPDGVIDKVPFTASWSINKITAENDMKNSVFYNKTPAQINTYIDNNWTNLTDSKETFKKAVKELRDVILRQGWED